MRKEPYIVRESASSARSASGQRVQRGKIGPLPYWSWAIIYYVTLFLCYHFLLYRYIDDVLDRQLLGLKDAICLPAALAAYIFLVALPAYLWSKWSYYHPLWRGIEAFLCYAAVALILGGIIAAAEGGDWTVFSGLTAAGTAWAIVGSLLIMICAFILASWLGGRKSPTKRRRARPKRKKKNDNEPKQIRRYPG
ncbi:MAG: hypothetical protein SWK76_09150 [Actinomycetota bacterium]|nr:hypothetical protein [Actinomycetota bacterium]